MKCIYKKELKSYFTSPFGYIYLGLTLVISGLVFGYFHLLPTDTQMPSADMTYFFSNQIFLILLTAIFLPILSMGLIADEKKNKTDQLLLTSPTSVTEVVLGKYLASVTLFGISILVMMFYPIILKFYGEPPLKLIYTRFLGLFLLGCSILAIGIFISSLCKSQFVAIILSIFVAMFLWLSDWILSILQYPVVAKFMYVVSIYKRYEQFSLGVLDFSVIIYYLSIISVFIMLSVVNIERKRWS